MTYKRQQGVVTWKSNPLLLPLWGSGRGRGFMRGFAPRKCPRGGELVSFTMSNPLPGVAPPLSKWSGQELGVAWCGLSVVL